MHSLVPVILVMNDEFWLPYTLQCIRGKFPRYVIYDIGSTDGTENVIDWFIEKEKNRASLYVRKLPFVDPQIQGIFRNSMIAEAQSDWYFIVDGDEVYREADINSISKLNLSHGGMYPNTDVVYGVFTRKEFNRDLTQQYSIKRSHHRLYHRKAIWVGTHPGEEAVIRQKQQTEDNYPYTCYHFHGTTRSSNEAVVPSRNTRKQKATYTPGNLIPVNLLEEVPLLRTSIEDFPACPELERLQYDYGK